MRRCPLMLRQMRWMPPMLASPAALRSRCCIYYATPENHNNHTVKKVSYRRETALRRSAIVLQAIKRNLFCLQLGLAVPVWRVITFQGHWRLSIVALIENRYAILYCWSTVIAEIVNLSGTVRDVCHLKVKNRHFSDPTLIWRPRSGVSVRNSECPDERYVGWWGYLIGIADYRPTFN